MSGDWVHIRNPNDLQKPIVAQIYRLWQDEAGKQWINACWYYRPEQTVHRVSKRFYKNEVMKTGQYRDHLADDIVDRCFVMFHTRYHKGRPRGFPRDKDIYVCEARYNEEKYTFNRIKTWTSCLPDEVREKDYQMDMYDLYNKLRKEPTPIAHLLSPDAKESDPLPKPNWGHKDAPPIIGGVHMRPREANVSHVVSFVIPLGFLHRRLARGVWVFLCSSESYALSCAGQLPSQGWPGLATISYRATSRLICPSVFKSAAHSSLRPERQNSTSHPLAPPPESRNSLLCPQSKTDNWIPVLRIRRRLSRPQNHPWLHLRRWRPTRFVGSLCRCLKPRPLSMSAQVQGLLPLLPIRSSSSSPISHRNSTGRSVTTPAFPPSPCNSTTKCLRPRTTLHPVRTLPHSNIRCTSSKLTSRQALFQPAVITTTSPTPTNPRHLLTTNTRPLSRSHA